MCAQKDRFAMSAYLLAARDGENKNEGCCAEYETGIETANEKWCLVLR
jgi:hypothetical protein